MGGLVTRAHHGLTAAGAAHPFQRDLGDAVRGAAAQLAAFVGGLPGGTLVAGAGQDEASNHLTAEAVTALRTLGVATDLRGRFRESHAFVGVKGATPGTALEAAGP